VVGLGHNRYGRHAPVRTTLLASGCHGGIVGGMKKPLAGRRSLWLYSGWYSGSMLAALLGVPEPLGVMAGAAAAALVVADPRRAIWGPRPTAPEQATTPRS